MPSVFQGIALSYVKDQVEPPDTSVLVIDWEGRFLKDLQLQGETSNLLVAAKDGSVVLRVSGPPDKVGTESVARTLDGLLKDFK